MIRDLQDDLQFALRLADIADEISLRNFGQANAGSSLIVSNGAPRSIAGSFRLASGEFLCGRK